MSLSPIPVFVVSLKKDTDRRAVIAERLAALDIEFAFFDAFNAKEDLHTLSADEVYVDPKKHISPPEYGCSLSHAFLYKKLVNEQIAHALILEDDAIPLPELATFLQTQSYLKAPLMTLYHGRSYVHPGVSIPLFDEVVARPLNLNCSHTVAYTLNLDAAKQLMHATSPVTDIPDWPMEIADLGACIVRPVLVQHPPHEQGSGLAIERRRKPKSLKRYLTKAHYRRKWRRRRSERIEPQLLPADYPLDSL